MEIKTERLTLRPMELPDAEDLHAVFRDPRAMRYWSTLPHDSLDTTREMIAQSVGADRSKHAEFSIIFGGKVIGKAGLWTVPEIGYILHPDYWGQGFGEEAVRAVIDHGFGALGLPHILADVDPDNAASLKMLAKLGFVETGRAEKTIKIGDQWFDSIYLTLYAPI